MQIGLYGAFGSAADHALRLAGINQWWGMWTLAGWAAISLLSPLRLRTNAVIIGALISAEIGFVAVVDVIMLAHPAGGELRYDALNPMLLANPTGIASLVGAITGLVGFEVPLAFALVAVNPRGTVSRAIKAILLVVAVLYGGTGLIMTMVAGPDQIIAAAAAHPPTCTTTSPPRSCRPGGSAPGWCSTRPACSPPSSRSSPPSAAAA